MTTHFKTLRFFIFPFSLSIYCMSPEWSDFFFNPDTFFNLYLILFCISVILLLLPYLIYTFILFYFCDPFFDSKNHQLIHENFKKYLRLNWKYLIKISSIIMSGFFFLVSLSFWSNFNKSLVCFQYANNYYYIGSYDFQLNHIYSTNDFQNLNFNKVNLENFFLNYASSFLKYIEAIPLYYNYSLDHGIIEIMLRSPHLFYENIYYYNFYLYISEHNISKYINTEVLTDTMVKLMYWEFNNNPTYNLIDMNPLLPYASFGIDGVSLFFIILTTWLIFICFLVSWETINSFIFEYALCFFLLELFLLIAFTTTDLLIFYIAFESILIPMFFIVGIWGSRSRKIKAGYQFFLYTLFGSVFLLLAILVINIQLGTTDIDVLLLSSTISYQRQLILWWAFFFSFAVKVPMIPAHIWLPEAHVEAPTTGSVILAGILLKLGTYGFIRFTIPLLPYACIYYSPFIYTLSLVAIIYTSLTTLRQIDLKKIIAYSSVAHMNFVTLGIFSLNIYGIEGSIILMLSHGIVSSALFICIGILYDRCHTRIMKYYGGLTITMPIFSIFFFIFILANLSMPGTSSFVGEFLILIGTFEANSTVAFFASFSIVLSAGYSIWLYNRLMFGLFIIPYKVKEFWLKDLTYREFFILFICTFLVFLMGIYPNIFLSYLHISCTNVINYLF